MRIATYGFVRAALVVGLVWHLHTCGVGAVDPEDVIVKLTPKAFNSSVNDGDVWMVEFFAPWCGHCKHFRPTWEKFAVEADQRTDVRVATVDCVAHMPLCKSQGVKGFPSIRMYVHRDTTGGAGTGEGGDGPNGTAAQEKEEKDGKEEEKLFYEGDRTLEGLMKHLVEKGVPVHDRGDAVDTTVRIKRSWRLVQPRPTRQPDAERRLREVKAARDMQGGPTNISSAAAPPSPQSQPVEDDAVITAKMLREKVNQTGGWHLIHFGYRYHACWKCRHIQPMWHVLATALYQHTKIKPHKITCAAPASAEDACGTIPNVTQGTPTVALLQGMEETHIHSGPLSLVDMLAFVERVTATRIPVLPEEVAELREREPDGGAAEVPPKSLYTPMVPWWSDRFHPDFPLANETLMQHIISQPHATPPPPPGSDNSTAATDPSSPPLPSSSTTTTTTTSSPSFHMVLVFTRSSAKCRRASSILSQVATLLASSDLMFHRVDATTGVDGGGGRIAAKLGVRRVPTLIAIDSVGGRKVLNASLSSPEAMSEVVLAHVGNVMAQDSMLSLPASASSSAAAAEARQPAGANGRGEEEEEGKETAEKGLKAKVHKMLPSALQRGARDHHLDAEAALEAELELTTDLINASSGDDDAVGGNWYAFGFGILCLLGLVRGLTAKQLRQMEAKRR